LFDEKRRLGSCCEHTMGKRRGKRINKSNTEAQNLIFLVSGCPGRRSELKEKKRGIDFPLPYFHPDLPVVLHDCINEPRYIHTQCIGCTRPSGNSNGSKERLPFDEPLFYFSWQRLPKTGSSFHPF
jgi:hypothetical protein